MSLVQARQKTADDVIERLEKLEKNKTDFIHGEAELSEMVFILANEVKRLERQLNNEMNDVNRRVSKFEVPEDYRG